MLCERCKKEQAVVHLTIVTPDGEEKRNLCESCYRGSGIARKLASAGLDVAPAKKPGWSADIVDLGKLRYEFRKRRRKKKP